MVRLAHRHRLIAFSRVLCTRSSTAAKWATFFLKQFYNSVDPFSYILFRRCAVCHARGAVRLHRATRRCADTTSSKTIRTRPRSTSRHAGALRSSPRPLRPAHERGWPSSGKCGAVGVIEIAQALACRSAWVPRRSPVRKGYRRANAITAPTVLSIAESTLSSGCEGGPDPRRHSPHCAREACGGLALLHSPAKPVVTAPAAVRAPTCRVVHRGAGRRCSAGCRSW